MFQILLFQCRQRWDDNLHCLIVFVSILNHPMYSHVNSSVPWRWVKSYWRWIGVRNFYVRAVRCHHQSLEVEQFKLQWVQCVFCSVLLLGIQTYLDDLDILWYDMTYFVILSTRSVRCILRNCKDAGWPSLPQPMTLNNNQQANSIS